MPGRKTLYPANARFCFGDEQSLAVNIEAIVGQLVASGPRNRSQKQRSKSRPGCGCRPRGCCRDRGNNSDRRRALPFLPVAHFSLPGARGAVRRDQYPLVGQSVQPAMGIFVEFQGAASQHSTTKGRCLGSPLLGVGKSMRHLKGAITAVTPGRDLPHSQGLFSVNKIDRSL